LENPKKRSQLSLHLTNANGIINQKGLINLIMRFIYGLIHLDKSIIFKKELDNILIYPLKIQKTELKIVSSKNDFSNLLLKGYKISPFFNEYELSENIKKNQILFLLFTKKQLIHKTWVLTNQSDTMDMPLKVDWDTQAYIQLVETHPDYRNLGAYTYVSSMVFEYLKKQGKKSCLCIASKNNLASIKSDLNAGYKKYGEGSYIRIFYFLEYWKTTLKN
tara:strand:- start:84 stop:740 length:657 start_codon:yes stop_codon:yes gene_type:complete